MTLSSIYRTHTCGEVRPADIGKEIRVAGWVENIRDHGGILFLDIRDQYGIVQIVVHDETMLAGVNKECTITAKGKNFTTQAQEFQRKLQSNQFTQQQYEAEQVRLSKLQQDLEALQVRLSNSLQEEYQKEFQNLTDTIQSFTKSYAKQKGYDFIFCKSSGIDNVLYANEAYDVTDEVVKALNKRYKNTSPKKEEKKDK